jgi:hypothetical protein
MGQQMISENPKKAFGALKPCAHYAPMNVMAAVYRVFELGAKKYGLKNWRKQPVDASTYYSAAHRHLTAWFEAREDNDPESGVSHLAHAIACCMIIMDGLQQQGFIDDRAKVEVLTSEPRPPFPLTDEQFEEIANRR